MNNYTKFSSWKSKFLKLLDNKKSFEKKISNRFCFGKPDEFATDQLTGALCRRAMIDYFDLKVNSSKEERSGLGLLFLDLFKFKNINDSYGHSAGDMVLRETSNRIKNIINDKGAFSRFGGDEFVVIIDLDFISFGIEEFCCELRKSILQPIKIQNGVQINVDVSIGFSIFRRDSNQFENLLNLADLRMYAMKRSQYKERFKSPFKKKWVERRQNSREINNLSRLNRKFSLKNKSNIAIIERDFAASCDNEAFYHNSEKGEKNLWRKRNMHNHFIF